MLITFILAKFLISSRFLPSLNTPAVIRLIHHAGHKGKDIVCAVIQHRHIVDGDLRHGIDLIGAGAEFGGVGDLIANGQRVDLAEVVCHATVMRGKGHIAVPDGGAGEMPRALLHSGHLPALRPVSCGFLLRPSPVAHSIKGKSEGCNTLAYILLVRNLKGTTYW